MIEERQELAPLAQHVEHGLAECAQREHSVGHLVEPGPELRHNRRGLGLPNAEPFISRRSFDLSLDAIQLPDQIQRDPGLPIATRVGLRLARVLEPATGVRVAARVDQPLGLRDCAVSLIAVGLQDASKALQQPHGHCTAAGRIIVEQDDPPMRRPRRSDPDPMFGRGSLATAQHLDSGLVHLDYRGLEQSVSEQ